jgi:hypothetical protein
MSLKQMGGCSPSHFFSSTDSNQTHTHSTSQHAGLKHTRLISRMSKGPSPRPRRRRHTPLLRSPATIVIMLLATASAVRAASGGLAFVQHHARIPAKLRMFTTGTRTTTMPSSTRIRDAAGGNDEGSSSPSLLLDERISLAPMMEYTDRYEISTQTQRGRGGGMKGGNGIACVSWPMRAVRVAGTPSSHRAHLSSLPYVRQAPPLLASPPL